MNNYTIGQYQYNIYFGEEGLSLKAINYESLIDYRCDIKQDAIEGYKLFNSLETLYTILVDGFTNKNKNNVKMNIIYEKAKDEINILLEVKFPYATEEFTIKLMSVKDLVNQQIIDNKMHYFNKRLTDVEGERKEIETLKHTVDSLLHRLEQLEVKTAINNEHILFGCDSSSSSSKYLYHVYIPLSVTLIMGSSFMDINGADFSFDPNINIDHYIKMCNLLIELKEAVIREIDIRDLKFIEKCTKLTELTLGNMTKLVDISSVLKLPVLKTLTITECKKITNLKILENCKNLELLKIQSSINTGVFSEELSFRIEII